MMWLAECCPKSIIQHVPINTPIMDSLRLQSDGTTIDRRRSTIAFRRLSTSTKKVSLGIAFGVPGSLGKYMPILLLI